MPSQLENIFENIYKTNEWSHGSGTGSLPENTEEYREFLQNFLRKNNIKTVLDAGCGDWQFSKLIDWTGISYIGIDVVPFLIEENNKKYARENIKFYKKNVLESELPKADLIILKDVLQHLSNENILKILSKLEKFKFIIIVNHFSAENYDCQDGQYRPIDLKKAPFNLGGETFTLSKNEHFSEKQILVVKRIGKIVRIFQAIYNKIKKNFV